MLVLLSWRKDALEGVEENDLDTKKDIYYLDSTFLFLWNNTEQTDANTKCLSQRSPA